MNNRDKQALQLNSIKTAVERTSEIIAPGGKWHGNRADEAKAKWFLNRAKKRDRQAKLAKASRKRNRK